MLHATHPSKILVFLPQNAGMTIVSRLMERGFQSILATNPREASEALHSGECSFAITTRPDIDLLRNIRAVPVINLEVFFHAGFSSDGVASNVKKFDDAAFMERVEFLAQASMIASEKEADVAAKPTAPAKGSQRWRGIVAHMFRPHKRGRVFGLPS